MHVNNFKIGTTTNGSCILADNAAIKNLGGINFGAAAFAHWHTTNNGLIYGDYGTGAYTISGNALVHFYGELGGTFYIRATTITGSGAVAFSSSFANLTNASKGFFDSLTFSGTGSFTGPRYSVQSNSVINTFGGGANYFPGNSAGATATGGQYA